jgi:hypothetical protein
MSDANRPITSVQPDTLWLALLSYTIGPDDAALSFAQRLARENGWTLAQAERVILEYKRFCYLGVTCDHPVTPSDAVDQAWHLHLTYTRDYWQRFCPTVLGRDFHHGPTAGGPVEADRYFNQYALTLRSYERAFGEEAPRDLWHSAAQRLREDPKARRVHPREGWVVRKRPAVILVAAVVLVLLVWVFH